jgi:uncharacterized SAM-binding protein YcdF (DUF218 family)
MTDEALRLARVIWDYHQLGQTPIPADVIIALGTNDLRVAHFAAKLFRHGFGETLLCTGGFAHQSDLLATAWPKTEAEMYADIAAENGVPRDRILLEKRATNTAENIRFSRDLLVAYGIRPRNVVIAVKPFMQRRVGATLAVEWPEMPASLSSPEMALDDYFTEELNADKIVNIMLGDLQRIWVYARRGWSAPQRIPAEVLDAYMRLVQLGYAQHLIPGEAIPTVG